MGMAGRFSPGDGEAKKQGDVVKVARCYKNVTRKTGLAALESLFLCILQLNRAVKSENNSFEMSSGLDKYNIRFFTDCSGGNSSPSYPADAGGCIF
jgi:hypothetical protein